VGGQLSLSLSLTEILEIHGNVYMEGFLAVGFSAFLNYFS
jgi:hypothetical protein